MRYQWLTYCVHTYTTISYVKQQCIWIFFVPANFTYFYPTSVDIWLLLHEIYCANYFSLILNMFTVWVTFLTVFLYSTTNLTAMEIENQHFFIQISSEHLYCTKEPFFNYYRHLLLPPTTVYICKHNTYFSGTHDVCH